MVCTVSSLPPASVTSTNTGVLTICTGENGPLMRLNANEKIVVSFGNGQAAEFGPGKCDTAGRQVCGRVETNINGAL